MRLSRFLSFQHQYSPHVTVEVVSGVCTEHGGDVAFKIQPRTPDLHRVHSAARAQRRFGNTSSDFMMMCSTS